MRSIRATRISGAVLLLGLLLAPFGAAPAQATGHARLISTTPASGASLTRPPGAVQLVFDGNVISMGLQFQVIGPSGLVTQGKPVVNRGTVRQPLIGELVNGAYVVNWHVVHDDGHPDQGSFTFAVAVPGGPTATGPPVSVAPLPDLDDTDVNAGLPPFLVVAGMLVVALIVAVAAIADRRRRSAELRQKQ